MHVRFHTRKSLFDGLKHNRPLFFLRTSWMFLAQEVYISFLNKILWVVSDSQNIILCYPISVQLVGIYGGMLFSCCRKLHFIETYIVYATIVQNA